jgi:hypothetical protein
MQQSKRALQLQAIGLRRHRVLEYLSNGYTSSRDIAAKLNLEDHTTVYRDIKYWTKISQKDIKNHFESLPLEIKKCITGLESTIRILSDMLETTEGRDRIDILNSRMQAYRFKMELLDGKATVSEVFSFIDKSRGSTTQKGKLTRDVTTEHT